MTGHRQSWVDGSTTPRTEGDSPAFDATGARTPGTHFESAAALGDRWREVQRVEGMRRTDSDRGSAPSRVSDTRPDEANVPTQSSEQLAVPGDGPTSRVGRATPVAQGSRNGRIAGQQFRSGNPSRGRADRARRVRLRWARGSRLPRHWLCDAPPAWVAAERRSGAQLSS